MNPEIEKWQHSIATGERGQNPEPSTSKADGIASRLSTAASELFGLVLKNAQSQTPKAVFRKLEREYGHLRLWCDGHGAVSGELDDVLADSKRLRHLTNRLLVSLCETLTDKLVVMLLPALDEASQHKLREKAARTRDVVEATTFAIHDADGSDDDSSDSSSDASSVSGQGSVEDIIEDLKTDIQCLVDLGPRYKEPIRDRAVAEKAALPADVASWDPAEYLTSRICHRYPDADAELARSLGRANWNRFQKLRAVKEQNLREEAQQKTGSDLKPPSTAFASDFRDSGLGASVATPTSYAETLLSYRGTKGGSIKIPPIPPEALQGKWFACDICGRKCQLPWTNWKSFWKKHVLSDLEPYVCIFASCQFNTVPFSDKKQWTHHLELEHGFADPSKQLTCPLCQGQVDSGQGAHMARHLEEISLTILAANAECDEESGGSLAEESDAESSVSPIQETTVLADAAEGDTILFELPFGLAVTSQSLANFDPFHGDTARDDPSARPTGPQAADISGHANSPIDRPGNLSHRRSSISSTSIQSDKGYTPWTAPQSQYQRRLSPLNSPLPLSSDYVPLRPPRFPATSARFFHPLDPHRDAPPQVPGPEPIDKPRLAPFGRSPHMSDLLGDFNPVDRDMLRRLNQRPQDLKQLPVDSPPQRGPSTKEQTEQAIAESPRSTPDLYKCPVHWCPYRAKKLLDVGRHMQEVHYAAELEEDARAEHETAGLPRPAQRSERVYGTDFNNGKFGTAPTIFRGPQVVFDEDKIVMPREGTWREGALKSFHDADTARNSAARRLFGKAGGSTSGPGSASHAKDMVDDNVWDVLLSTLGPDPFVPLTTSPAAAKDGSMLGAQSFEESSNADYQRLTEDLERHTSNPRPERFLCPESGCARTFSRLSDLRKHTMNHSRPYKCTICGARAAGLKDLRRHMRQRHPDEARSQGLFDIKAQCPQCGSTMRPDNLKRHLERGCRRAAGDGAAGSSLLDSKNTGKEESETERKQLVGFDRDV